jgi:hypothetical protein
VLSLATINGRIVHPLLQMIPPTPTAEEIAAHALRLIDERTSALAKTSGQLTIAQFQDIVVEAMGEALQPLKEQIDRLSKSFADERAAMTKLH